MEQPLACIRTVCASLLAVTALPHVEHIIDAFFPTSPWTLESASKRGLLRLMDRLLKYEHPGFNQECRLLRLKLAVEVSVKDGYDVLVLEWWIKRYMPGQTAVSLDRILELAIKQARIPVLEWLFRETNGDLPHLAQKVGCSDPDVTVWLYEHGRRHLNTTQYFHLCVNQFDYQSAKQCLIYKEEDAGGSFCLMNTNKVAEKAITCNLLEQVQWLYDYDPSIFKSSYLNIGIACGHLELVNWLYKKFPKHYFSDPAFYIQLRLHRSFKFSIDIFRWVLCEFEWADNRKRLNWMKDTMVFAAKKGSLEVLEMCRIQVESISGDQVVLDNCDSTNDSGLSQHILEIAAERGDLAIIQWVEVRLTHIFTSEAMNKAAKNGHLNVVQWLHQHRHEGCSPDAIDGAAGNGNLEMVRWLHDNRSEGCTTKAMDSAARGGHFNVVKWLHENRSEGCTTGAMDFAAQHGHLDIIKWLHENRSEGCTASALNSAARNGHLEVIKWLINTVNEGFAETALNYAAAHGRLEVVRFLHTNYQVHCAHSAMNAASRRGHLRTFKWLQEHQSEPFPALDATKWEELGPYSQLKCMALYTTHDRLGWTVDKFAECGDFETVELLLSDARRKGMVSIESKYVESL